ncbi:hypothetical protein TGPRC2_209560 [Toxoplasma gondii TgCatPRC2]|uniref:Uncharacterized protein n=3 Tax=Toxoplasma gondii TaxID=5811 RepID=A0A151HGW5_TOXGO|nr:hypothetical protein TGME49_209560 [Toxoplasma gondii ME49]EPT32308.1 hypothetical protein TGME49_209560 [Toxoplasma gondii ME49]KFG34831.1 hypothetical protein TGDOM2_209560 [Toxoplasma gondii GAB2-2007-GAL-DOM2]KYK68613.1 hypothetical protein TGPRC2_209560 [Toxoplasma gondii TgCatPRC2]|eukprot:XP_002369705.1 hypothetical protein TGME49_209560 [Toxoplasma gondii ME49]
MHRIHGWGPQYDVTAQQKLSELLAAAAVCAICSSNAFPALTQLGVTLSCVRASYEATLEALQKEPFRPSTDICRTTETAAILARTAEVAVNTEEVSASPGSGLVGGLILKTTHLTQPQSQGDTQNNCLTSITKTRSTAQAPRGTDEIPHRENQGSGLPVGSGNADGDPRIQRTLPSNHVRETVSSRCGCCPLESRSELLSSLVAARPDAASAVLEKNENSGTSDDWSAVVQAEPAPQRTLTPSSERITCRQRNTPRNRPPLCYPGFGDSEEVHTVKSVDGPAEDAIISVEKHDCGFNQCADNQRRYQTAACPTTPSLIPAPSASNTALSFRGNRCPHEKSPLRRLPLGESRSSITRQDVDEDASRCHIVPSRRASSRQESKEGIEAVSLKMNTTSHQTISYCSHHNSANDEGSSLLTHDCHRGCYDKDTTKGFCLATGISSPKLGVSGSSTAVPYNVLTATSTGSPLWPQRRLSQISEY